MIHVVARTADAELHQALQEATKKLQLSIDVLLQPIADEVFIEAKRTTAFTDRTCNLRRSIRIRKSKFPDGGWIVIASGGKGYKGYHAHLVELGHRARDGSWVQGRFFLRQAKTHGVQVAIRRFAGRETVNAI